MGQEVKPLRSTMVALLQRVTTAYRGAWPTEAWVGAPVSPYIPFLAVSINFETPEAEGFFGEIRVRPNANTNLYTPESLTFSSMSYDTETKYRVGYKFKSGFKFFFTAYDCAESTKVGPGFSWPFKKATGKSVEGNNGKSAWLQVYSEARLTVENDPDAPEQTIQRLGSW